MPFSVAMLLVIVCFVGSIAENKATTGRDLVLPQFETEKGMLITPWLHERNADERFWNAAYSMGGAPVDGKDMNSHNSNSKQRALVRLMLKMKHDIEQKGLISEKVETDIIQSYDSE